jgi:hypothetical protein
VWRPKKIPPPPYDPLSGLPDGPIRLSDQQAEALRHFGAHGSLREIYVDQFADEYKMERWLRAEVLIDPYNKVTRKGLASLRVFDERFSLTITAHTVTQTDEELEDDEADYRVNQRLRVPIDGGVTLSIHVAEIRFDHWFAETQVPVIGSKRKRKIEQYGASKSDVLHKILHDASIIRARAYARANS